MLISFIFLTMAWLIPNHYPPWVNFHSELLSFAGLMSLLIVQNYTNRHSIRMTGVVWGLIVASLVPWLQYAGGIVFYIGDAFAGSLYIVGLASAVVAGYNFSSAVNQSSNNNYLLMTTCAIALAALVSALLGCLQWLGQTDFLHSYAMHIEPGDRVVANLGQPNQLASLLLMGIVALVYLYERRQIGVMALVLYVSFVTWVLILAQSRTALMSAFAVAFFLQCKLRSVKTRLPRSYIAVWLVGLGIGSALLPHINAMLFFGPTRSTALSDANGRCDIWLQTLAAVSASPWLGYGWNQTPVAQAVGALAHPGHLAFTNAHNLGLDLVTWLGVPMGLLCTATGIYWFASRIKRIRTVNPIYAMGVIFPIAVHSMLEFPFAYAYFLLPVGFMVGVIEAALAKPLSCAIPRGTAWVVTAAFTSVGSYFAFEYSQIEEDYRIARFENIRIGQTSAEYERPKIYISTQFAALLTVLRQPAAPQMTPRQIEELRKVSLRFGYANLGYRYALALALNGDVDGAGRQMRVVRSMFGERYYQSVKTDFLVQAAQNDPVLLTVQLP